MAALEASQARSPHALQSGYSANRYLLCHRRTPPVPPCFPPRRCIVLQRPSADSGQRSSQPRRISQHRISSVLDKLQSAPRGRHGAFFVGRQVLSLLPFCSKAGGFRPSFAAFLVRCAASNSKRRLIWPKPACFFDSRPPDYLGKNRGPKGGGGWQKVNLGSENTPIAGTAFFSPFLLRVLYK